MIVIYRYCFGDTTGLAWPEKNCTTFMQKVLLTLQKAFTFSSLHQTVYKRYNTDLGTR